MDESNDVQRPVLTFGNGYIAVVNQETEIFKWREEEWLENPLITKRIAKIANLIDRPIELTGAYANMQNIYNGKWDQDLI